MPPSAILSSSVRKSDMGDVLYIINPAGHGGAGSLSWNAFKKLWPDEIDPADVVMTERPGHAQEVAATPGNHTVLVAVGGDGTVDEVMTGIMEREDHKPDLGIIPAGTGNDIARNANIFSVADAIDALRDRGTKEFDLVRVDARIDDHDEYRYAFLSASAGFSTNTMVRPWMKRLLGATVAYYFGSFLQILVYRAPEMKVRIDGQERDGAIYFVLAANSEWVSGGSMRIAPGALMDDGELNITIVPALPTFTIMTKLFPKIADGTHIDQPDVSYITGKKIEVTSSPQSTIETDGDLFGTTPATFTICPRAARVIVRKDI